MRRGGQGEGGCICPAAGGRLETSVGICFLLLLSLGHDGAMNSLEAICEHIGCQQQASVMAYIILCRYLNVIPIANGFDLYYDYLPSRYLRYMY